MDDVADDDAVVAAEAVVVVVLASLLLVVLSEGVLMIGFTGPVAVAVAVVDEAAVLLVVDGATATLVEEKTASFCAAAGGAPSVLAPVFLAESCMALVVSLDAPLGPASRGVTTAGSNRSTTSAVAAVAVGVALALSTTSATHSSTGFTASIVALVAVELPDLVSFSIFFSSLASNFSSPFFSALANFASSFSSFDEVAVVVEDFEDLDDDLEESLRTWGNRAVKLSSEFELKLE